MKTKELINALAEADPSGELDVVVSNSAITSVNKEPGYYDGCYFQIDPPALVGTKYKVQIRSLYIDWYLIDHPDAQISLPSYGPNSEQHYREIVERYRAEAKEALKEADEITK